MKLLWFLLISVPLYGANHYVRSAATGSATGADWTNAFTDLPVTLTRGDVYYVSSGSYAKHVFNDADSGVLVTEIRAATIADHGTSTGWSDSFQGVATWTATGSPTTNGCVIEFLTDHWLFDGNGVRGADKQSGFIMKVSNSNKVATTGPVCVGNTAGGTVGAGTWVQDVTIDYVDIDGPHDSVDTDCVGGNCTNVFVVWCGSTPHLNHSWVHDGGNVLIFIKGKHDSLSGAGGSLCNANSTGGKVILENSYFSRNYSSAAQHGEANECDEGAYCEIRYNVFRDITGTAFIASPSGCSRTTCNIDNRLDVYGNVFELVNTFQNNSVNCGVSGALQLFDAVYSGPINFVQNTLYNINTTICSNNAGGGNLVFPGAEADFNGNVAIRNNLWHNCDNFTAQTTCPNPPNTCAGTWTWDFSTYAGGQTTGGDSNAQTTASNLFVNSAGGDFHLATDTTAGVTLAAPFNVDPDGKIRGSSTSASWGGSASLGASNAWSGSASWSSVASWSTGSGTWDRGAYQK